MPRFASLKTDRVNLREGPSKEHATKWVYERAGLPVEITAEFEIWRKVRDSEGIEGWVLHSLLSGRRTALVTPNKKGENSKLYARASASADLAATLQSGVIVNIRNCDGAWCLVDGDGFKGYIEQEKLWGVYPDERKFNEAGRAVRQGLGRRACRRAYGGWRLAGRVREGWERCALSRGTLHSNEKSAPHADEALAGQIKDSMILDGGRIWPLRVPRR